MIIDCGTCSAGPVACTDCVVSVLLGPPGTLELADDHRAAVAALADSGLVPPLRLIAGGAEGGSQGHGAPRAPRRARAAGA